MNSMLLKLADTISPDQNPSLVSSGTDGDKNVSIENADNKPEKNPPSAEKKYDGGKEEGGIEQPAAVPVGAGIDGQAVLDFFAENPAPKDSDYHSFAEQNGWDPSEAEEAAYRLAGLMATFLKEGKFAESGRSVDEFDPHQVEIGLEVEAEHSNDPVIQLKTVLDHLVEIEDYYDPWLTQMESQAKGRQEEDDQSAAEPIENEELVPEEQKDKEQSKEDESRSQPPQGRAES